MGATNTTTYYNLSQFVGTDKPAWLQDYNGDMLKIDTGINAAKVAADAAALDASAAQLDATTALGDITNTITPAITSLQTTVGNQGGAINTINSLIGNGTPTTTDQTIIGAINEINAEVGNINTALNTDTTFTPTLNTTYVTAHSGYDNTCIKVGNLVFLNLCLDIVANISNNTIVTIPDGYRPKYAQVVDLGETGNLLKINTDGTMTGYVPATASHISINMVYFAG